MSKGRPPSHLVASAAAAAAATAAAAPAARVGGGSAARPADGAPMFSSCGVLC